MNMLSASLFSWIDTCRRRVWRDIHLDYPVREQPSIYVTQVADDQTASPRKHLVALKSWEEGIQLTREDMQKQVPVILGAQFELVIDNPFTQTPLKLGARVDRLQRQPDGLYVPIMMKVASEPTEQDEAQLSFQAWMLSQIQDVAALSAAFWLGQNPDGTPKKVIPFECDYDAVEAQINAALALIARPQPDATRMPGCKHCHWYKVCFPEVARKKSIALMSGLRTETQKVLVEAGIQTLDQIVEMAPEDLCKFRGIKTTAHSIHASARAWVEERAVWYDALHPTCLKTPIYFDIETIPYDRNIWSIGWAEEGKPVRVVIVDSAYSSAQIALSGAEVIDVAPDADSAWRFFAQAVSHNDAPIFHWTSFDAATMRAEAPKDVCEALLPRLHDLNRSLDKAVKFPVRGTSLKTIGVHLGYNWRAYDDWAAAFRDYQRWLAMRDLKAIASACTYQQDDVVAMMVVRKWLIENLPDKPGA